MDEKDTQGQESTFLWKKILFVKLCRFPSQDATGPTLELCWEMLVIPRPGKNFADCPRKTQNNHAYEACSESHCEDALPDSCPSARAKTEQCY
jgi:hypothetical protein